MRYVTLGATDLRVSRLCLGMLSYGRGESAPWALHERDAEVIVRCAAEGGVTFFDTADFYGGGASEIVTGRLLRRIFGAREEYVVATKVHVPARSSEHGLGLSRERVLASVDASLERLGLDHIDLYQVHRWDPTTPIAETMDALHEVVKSGKVRYIGACSMHAWQFAKAQSAAATRFVSMQNHYNLIYREEEREMIPQCIDQGVAVLPWSPLARGLLARPPSPVDGRPTARSRQDPLTLERYRSNLDAPVITRLAEVAAARGLPRAQTALAWLLHKPGVTSPIVGATKREHVVDALAAERLELEAAEIARLDEPYLPHPISGHE